MSAATPAAEGAVEGSEPAELIPLAPRDGTPEVIETPRGLTRALSALAGGSGPIGIDAERASGFRYGQRAYLIQLYRVDGGTWLIDPIALPDLSRLAQFLAPLEWILHAASQDLPCLAEVGLHPTALFDTELAGRLLGRERVGLAPLVAAELGYHLAKGHGAADWSTRPLPEDWRTYAALDVEVLPALRDRLADALREAGKEQWAEEEFAALVSAPPAPPRVDPWRRTSGLHKVKSRRALAIVRSLWQTRDQIAQQRDIAPGRLLSDATIVAIATDPPATEDDLGKVPGINRARGLRRQWWRAVEEARALRDEDLPEVATRGDGPPPPRMWASRDPAAAARLQRAKTGLAALSNTWNIPVENLATPDTVRRVLWQPPEPADAAQIARALAAQGVRPWQRELVVPVLHAAINDVGAESHEAQDAPAMDDPPA